MVFDSKEMKILYEKKLCTLYFLKGYMAPKKLKIASCFSIGLFMFFISFSIFFAINLWFAFTCFFNVVIPLFLKYETKNFLDLVFYFNIVWPSNLL